MNLTIARQMPDIALLRAIGATPGRIRRSVVFQAAIMAVPSAGFGYLAGIAAGRAWTTALRAHGVLPQAVTFRADPLVLPLVIGIVIVTSVGGALAAAVRPARIRPAVALTEAGTRRPNGGVPRILAGLAMVAAGAVNALANSSLDLLAMSVGVGVLGPVLLRAVVALARPLTAGSARLAVDNVGAMSRALVPLVLVIAFAAAQVAMQTTSAHRGAAAPAGEQWISYSGTAVYCTFAAIGALDTLITVTVGRQRDLAVAQLAGGTRGRVLAVVICEAVLVAVTALVLAAGTAIATLLPALRTVPYVPAAYLMAGALLAAGTVAAGTVGPAVVLTRRRAFAVVAAAE
jgi:putative ABC transport system permease protein